MLHGTWGPEGSPWGEGSVWSKFENCLTVCAAIWNMGTFARKVIEESCCGGTRLASLPRTLSNVLGNAPSDSMPTPLSSLSASSHECDAPGKPLGLSVSLFPPPKKCWFLYYLFFLPPETIKIKEMTKKKCFETFRKMVSPKCPINVMSSLKEKLTSIP